MSPSPRARFSPTVFAGAPTPSSAFHTVTFGSLTFGSSSSLTPSRPRLCRPRNPKPRSRTPPSSRDAMGARRSHRVALPVVLSLPLASPSPVESRVNQTIRLHFQTKYLFVTFPAKKQDTLGRSTSRDRRNQPPPGDRPRLDE